MPRRLLAVVLCLFCLVLFSASALGEPVKRRRRAPPPSSSPSAPAEQGPTPAKKPPSAAPARAKPGGGGGTIDERIRSTEAAIRQHKRKVADALAKAGLNGTAMHTPGGVSPGTAVDYTTVHAKKQIRGQVKATGSGPTAPATITASKPR